MKLNYKLGRTYLGKNLPRWVLANYIVGFIQQDPMMNPLLLDEYMKRDANTRFRLTKQGLKLSLSPKGSTSSGQGKEEVGNG